MDDSRGQLTKCTNLIGEYMNLILIGVVLTIVTSVPLNRNQLNLRNRSTRVYPKSITTIPNGKIDATVNLLLLHGRQLTWGIEPDTKVR